MHPKAQHYVPQFYLRSFAERRKKEFFVCCFDKATHKTFKPNVKNVANQTGFYDFISANGEKTSAESFFSDIETKTQGAIQALIENPKISVLSEHRNTFSTFFALQESRTVVFRDVHNQMIAGANQRLRQNGILFPAPTDNDTKEFQALFLIDTSSMLASVLLEMRWILVANKTNKPFWTSDNPIIRYNPHKSEFIDNLGLKSRGIQLHIPISPWLAIIICDPNEYAHMNTETFAEPPNVDFNNSGQVLESRQYIFSVDNDFSLAQEMINKTPELSNPNRSKVIVQ